MPVLVVVVFIGAWWSYSNKMPSLNDLGYKNQPSSSPTPAPKVVIKQVVKKTGSATASVKTYNELVKEYEGRRIQFDINCQAVPNSVTYKNGTTIMLDNRSGDSRVVTLDGTRYQLAGYGYATVTLSGQSLPKEMSLSCGAAINVGKILLQAQILQ